MYESGSYLKVGATTVEKLETLQERPLVLAHDVASQGARRSTLASHRVDED